ncbi:MAG: SDR family NAD(P)-dependent oxidoreductase [Pseudomonadota bacterium]
MAALPQRFQGKRALVTGAARGVGRAIAERFLAEGAEVLLADVLEIEGPLHDRARSLTLNVADPGAAETLLKELGEGPLDFLINNAGIGGSKALMETSDADWERFLETNLTSVFRLCRDLVPLLPAPGGRIVNIASVFALTGFPGSLSYSVAKAGVAQLTRQIAVDLAPSGILVNAIAPGVIETAMTARRIAGDAWYQKIQIEATPLGRVGQPEDIAGVAAFLCSEDAAFVTGQVLAVDGGWLESKYLPRHG